LLATHQWNTLARFSTLAAMMNTPTKPAVKRAKKTQRATWPACVAWRNRGSAVGWHVSSIGEWELTKVAVGRGRWWWWPG
jgi:hypothetical protein